MTPANDPVGQLSRAVDQTGAIISRIRPDQAALPTPCTSFDVQALVEHVVKDLRTFTVRASRGEWKPREDAGAAGDDWDATYREAAAALLGAWRREGALDGTIELPFGEFPATWFLGQHITDLVVHSWDLARATGQPMELDPDLGQTALDWGKSNLRPEFRGDEASGRDFGAEVPVPEEAEVYDRLAGFFGRDPEWAAGDERA
jgi:uncharacterized protein (TIGR03086 family)